MIDFQLNFKCQLSLLLVATLLSAVSCVNYWEVKANSSSDVRYHVPIRLYYRGQRMTRLGILLNDRYVLTTYENILFGVIPLYDMKILVEYYGERYWDLEGVEYDVLKRYTYKSLALLGTVKRIDLKTHRRTCIKLPNSRQAALWGKPDNIPNRNSLFKSSCWDTEKPNAEVIVRQGNRRCDYQEIIRIPKHLIPTCLTAKDDRCILEQGAALEFDETLMGIRFYTGLRVPEPFEAAPYNVKYDLFKNIVPYLDWLQDVMVYYTPCETLSKMLSS